MPPEPQEKRTVVFVDGQNLFRAAKDAFGSRYPDYDPLALSREICSLQQWSLTQVRFYTGVPDYQDNEFWHAFWGAKLTSMGKRGIWTFSRPLRYRNETIFLADGNTTTALVGQEKGIDIRIALDVVRLAREAVFDVALIFSQDQDLSEMADEVKMISRKERRWIKVASAFPISPTYRNTRGINGTEWILIKRDLYRKCLDPNDYRTIKR